VPFRLPFVFGESLSFTVDLNRLYKITEPGFYTLDVSRISEKDNRNSRSRQGSDSQDRARQAAGKLGKAEDFL
jgi:hypothetical protein